MGLTEEVASAKEDASRAQEALESEKEKVQSMIERVDAAEKMVGAFEDKEAVTAREAGELTEILSQEKVCSGFTFAVKGSGSIYVVAEVLKSFGIQHRNSRDIFVVWQMFPPFFFAVVCFYTFFR